MVTAELKNYRQSPRKVRLVADMVRGKKVSEAIDLLTLTVKRSADPLQKLIKSAVANAEHNHGLKADGLYIKEIRVDEGVTLHRWRARARGRASAIRKRTSRVKLTLDTKDGKGAEKMRGLEDEKKKMTKAPVKSAKSAKTAAKSAAKKAPAKKTVAKKAPAKKPAAKSAKPAAKTTKKK